MPRRGYLFVVAKCAMVAPCPVRATHINKNKVNVEHIHSTAYPFCFCSKIPGRRDTT
jgi:hypothetical protein